MVVFDVASVKTTSTIAPGRHFSMSVEQLYLPKSCEKKYSYTENEGSKSRHSVTGLNKGACRGVIITSILSIGHLSWVYLTPFTLQR